MDTKHGHCPMKTPLLHFSLAVLGSFGSPLAFAHQPSSSSDTTNFQPFDSEQWERALRPAGKQLQDLNVGEPRTVRLFYFLPNDMTYRAEVVAAMKTGIVELQTFFAEQMETHGHGRKTFQFETDDQGDPVVHRSMETTPTAITPAAAIQRAKLPVFLITRQTPPL